MPLPSLTADRAVDDTAADAALPYLDPDRWRRPYRPGPWRVAAGALLLLLSSYLLFAAVIIALAGAVPGAGLCVGGAVAVIAYTLRLLRAGVWVSPRGLRRVGVLTTTTVTWERLSAVRTAQQPVRWLGMPRRVQGQALVAEMSGPAGAGPPRPLLTDHGADFIGRPEAFDTAADAVEGWAARYSRG